MFFFIQSAKLGNPSFSNSFYLVFQASLDNTKRQRCVWRAFSTIFQINQIGRSMSHTLAKKRTAEDSCILRREWLLCITSAMASGYLKSFTRAIILFLKSWNNLLHLKYLAYLWHTWTAETEDNISLVDHLLLALKSR